MKKKLVFFISEDWVFISHRLHLGKFALEENYEVTVVCNISEFSTVIENSGIKLVDWRIDRGGENPIVILKNLWRTFKILKNESPDLVMTVSLKPILLVGVAQFFVGNLRNIFCITGLGSIFTSANLKYKLLQRIVSILLRLFLKRRGNNVVVQNLDDMTFFSDKLQVPKNKISLIKGAGVDIYKFFPNRENKGEIVVSLPARALKDKGVEEFVEVARQVNFGKKSAIFRLIGWPDSNNPNSISVSQLENWNDEGIIEWVGRQTDMVSALQKSHIICFPSYREGLPKALLEACACAKPIVAFDVPGVRELIKHNENGFLVKFGNIEKLAFFINKLIADDALRDRMGKAGRTLVENHFSEAKIQRQFKIVWNSKINAKTPGTDY